MKMKNALLSDIKTLVYLVLLVKKTTHLNYLSEFKNISLCSVDMKVPFISGLNDLAAVAEKKISITSRKAAMTRTTLCV